MVYSNIEITLSKIKNCTLDSLGPILYNIFGTVLWCRCGTALKKHLQSSSPPSLEIELRQQNKVKYRRCHVLSL